MKKHNSKLLLRDVQTSNYYNNIRRKDVIEYALMMQNDSERDKRFQHCECPLCYYSPNDRIVMNAFYDANCAICNTTMKFSNSDTDKLCKDCSTKYELCRECGSDLDYKDKPKHIRNKELLEE